VNSKEIPVIIDSGGQQIVGMYHLPDAGKSPCVVMLHGFRGNKQETHRMFVQQARELARSGVAALRFDFRGCGDSAGEFHEMTVSSMCADAKAVLAWVMDRAETEIDPDRVAILGMSLGGMIASLLSHACPVFRAGVLWCPVTNPRRVLANRTTPDMQQQMDGSGVTDLSGWAVGKTFVAEMMTADPAAALRHAKFPLLVVHGTADETVPFEDSVATVESLRKAGCDARLHAIEGADHGHNSLPWTGELIRTTTGWFARHLGVE